MSRENFPLERKEKKMTTAFKEGDVSRLFSIRLFCEVNMSGIMLSARVLDAYDRTFVCVHSKSFPHEIFSAIEDNWLAFFLEKNASISTWWCSIIELIVRFVAKSNLNSDGQIADGRCRIPIVIIDWFRFNSINFTPSICCMALIQLPTTKNWLANKENFTRPITNTLQS